MQWRQLPITKAFPAITCRFPSRRSSTGIPEFRKYGDYTAFVEGWALYSERLGKEVGFYQDPYSDYGRLEADIWRAIRLVVDTGVHSQHWTRDQMAQYFHDHSAIDETSIQSEVDRYIGWPGQALAYKIGQMKILELRNRAQKALGGKFDIRAFHDEVLDRARCRWTFWKRGSMPGLGRKRPWDSDRGARRDRPLRDILSSSFERWSKRPHILVADAEPHRLERLR